MLQRPETLSVSNIAAVRQTKNVAINIIWGKYIYIWCIYIYICVWNKFISINFRGTSSVYPMLIYIYTYIHVYVHLYVKYSLPPMGISASGSEAVEPSGWMPWRSCPTHGRWYACAAPQTWYVYGVYIYNTYVYTCSINICTNMVWKKKKNVYMVYMVCILYTYTHTHTHTYTYTCIYIYTRTYVRTYVFYLRMKLYTWQFLFVARSVSIWN